MKHTNIKSFSHLKRLSCIIIFIYILNIFTSISFASESVKGTNTTTSKESLELYSNNSIVIDAESGNILYDKNGHNKVYPASTTKIITAILAVENLDLDSSIVASKKAVYSTPAGSSIIALKAGEILTAKNLLYGLLVKSGNDAANVLAEAVSGDMNTFISLMNAKLKEIGCNDTNFTNAHGFHDKNHYTTPYDMAILMKHAMSYDTIREIFETKEIEIPATNKSEARKYLNTNKMFNEKYTKMYYEYILGGKTGYTEEARGTFVGYGRKDDKTVIVSVFDGSQNVGKQEARFLDSIVLFNYSFKEFNRYNILDKDKNRFKLIDKNIHKQYTLGLTDNYYALSKNDEFFTSYDITLDLDDIENSNKNDKIGTLSANTKGASIKVNNNYPLYVLEDSEYFSISNIQKNRIIKVIAIIILFIIWIALFTNLKKSKKYKRRKNSSNSNRLEYKQIKNKNSRQNRYRN